MADGRWLLALATTLMIGTGLPYLASANWGPADLERLGTFWFVRDFSQYQAAMREASHSASWLIHDRFTTEPHAPILMYPLYVALGKLAAATGIGDLTLFTALEWLSRLILLGAIWLFTITFLDGRKERRLALLLTTTTLGLAGWVLPLRVLLTGLGLGGPADLLPTSVNVYLEMNSLGVFLAAPHLMLGLALTLVSPALYLRACRGGRGWVVLLAAGGALLSLVHPFNLPVVATTFFADALLRGRTRHDQRHGTAKRWPLACAAAFLAAGLPMAAYNTFLFQLDPFWAGTYGVQNLMPSPAPWALPVDFGLVLLAAPLAWPALRAWPADRRRLVLVWVTAALLWMYVPVPYQRRFGFGLQPALAILASVGLLSLNEHMRQRAWGPYRRRLINYSLTLAAAMTSTLIYLALLSSAVRNQPAEAYLWTRAEANAARWLAGQTTAEDVVLASTRFANPLVGAFDGRVVHGHIVATRESKTKERLVQRFYEADTPPDERRALLRESRATVVAMGPVERALGPMDPVELDDLDLIYDRAGVQWWRVRTPPVA